MPADPLVMHKGKKKVGFTVVMDDDGSISVDSLPEDEFVYPDIKEFLYMTFILAETAADFAQTENMDEEDADDEFDPDSGNDEGVLGESE